MADVTGLSHFYATSLATRDLLRPEECRRFQRPYDQRVLDAAASAQFNIMHVCGAGAHFGEFADYPVAAFSWALAPGNPSLAEGHRRTGRAVMGGIPAKPEIGSMTPVEIGARVSAATADTEGRWLLLAPDCSITPDTPDVLLHAARQARDCISQRRLIWRARRSIAPAEDICPFADTLTAA